MTDNGAHSFTEGSEPIKLTEVQRIEKECKEIIQREIGIGPAATPLTPMDYGECLRCMIAIRKEERNKAIDEAMKLKFGIEKEHGILWVVRIDELESLKSDSK